MNSCVGNNLHFISRGHKFFNQIKRKLKAVYLQIALLEKKCKNVTLQARKCCLFSIDYNKTVLNLKKLQFVANI